MVLFGVLWLGNEVTTSKQTKRLVVEFFGPAREIAGVAEAEVEVKAQATVRDVLQALAASYPELLVTIIDAARWELKPNFLVNLDGRMMIKNLDVLPPHGARLMLMSALVGG